MLKYQRYRRVPVLHYPERKWPDREMAQQLHDYLEDFLSKGHWKENP